MKSPAETQAEQLRVAVKIYGEEYVVRGTSSREHILKIAAQVDEKMSLISRRNPNLSPKKLAILTALNIADELSQLQEDYDNLVKLLDDSPPDNG
ncbi:MAG: cell division protein ZapA [Bacillota bacterium]